MEKMLVSREEETRLAEAMYLYTDPRSPFYDPNFRQEIEDICGPESEEKAKARIEWINHYLRRLEPIGTG